MQNVINRATRNGTIDMKRNSRNLLTVSTLAVTLVLSACSSSGSSSSTGKSGSKTVGFVEGIASDTFFQTQKCAMQKHAKDVGINLIVSGGNAFTAQSQTPVLQTMIGKKPDAIIIDPTDPQAMVGPIKAAVQAKIPVLISGDEVNSEDGFAYVGVDQEAGGKSAADYMSKQLPDGGKVLVIGYSAGTPSTDAREKGFVEGAKSHSNLEILPVQRDASNSTQEAASIISSTLSKYPDLKGIYAVDEGIGNGAASQVQASKNKDIKVIAFDASPTEVQQLRSGGFVAIVSQQPKQLAVKSLDLTIDKLNGKNVPKKTLIQPLLITKENVDSAEGKAAIYTQCS